MIIGTTISPKVKADHKLVTSIWFQSLARTSTAIFESR
jgi:hypothetical protein